MTRKLAPDAVERYRSDGYLCPVDALSPEEAAAVRGKAEAFEREAGATLGKLPGQMRAKTHLLFTWASDLVRHAAILDAVEDLVGPDILVYHLTCWFKEAGDNSFVSWHQDATYFQLEPFEHVTAWVALSPSTPESGCVNVIPRTHRAGQLAHGMRPSPDNLLSNGQFLLADLDETHAVPLTLAPGQISLHHTHLVHGSNANRSNERRLGIGVSYIPTRVRYTGHGRLSASLVRGEDRFGHFDLEPRPRADFDQAARAAHAEACELFFAAHGSARTGS